MFIFFLTNVGSEVIYMLGRVVRKWTEFLPNKGGGSKLRSTRTCTVLWE